MSGKIQFSRDAHDPRYCHGGFPNYTGNHSEFTVSSWYFNVVLKERFFFFFKKGVTFTLPSSPSPKHEVMQTLVKPGVVEARSLLLTLVAFMRGVSV